jgi:hypothetical protein
VSRLPRFRRKPRITLSLALRAFPFPQSGRGDKDFDTSTWSARNAVPGLAPRALSQVDVSPPAPLSHPLAKRGEDGWDASGQGLSVGIRRVHPPQGPQPVLRGAQVGAQARELHRDRKGPKAMLSQSTMSPRIVYQLRACFAV